MPPSTRIPPLLQPYIRLPNDESLILLTSTLGASANWLIIRFLCDALSNHTQDGGVEGHNVVLVSWMRDHEFWKQESRKGAGLDLERLRREGRFAFVDGLSRLCLDGVEEQSAGVERIPPTAGLNAGRIPQTSSARTPQTLPVRGPPGRIVPPRGLSIPTPTPAATNTAAEITSMNKSTPGHYTLTSLDLTHLKTAISSAVSSLNGSPSASQSTTDHQRTLLILDNPDILLALNAAIDPSALTSLILDLHTLPTVSHILTHIQSDNPLLSLSTPPQPLELEHHNLLVKYAHMSRRILGVRVLDTGVARDVSGVIRVTEQKESWLDLGLGDDDGKDQAEQSETGNEFLYQIKGDGSAKVFERGAGGEG